MRNGFTLIEILLSIFLISILVAVAVPVYYTLLSRNDLDVAKNQIVQSLRRAEALALASDGDSTWGLKILSGSIVIFKGTNYDTGRDTNYDEIYQTSSAITPSVLTEVIFNKMTGFPQSSGSITLTSTNGETRTITINAKGQVGY